MTDIGVRPEEIARFAAYLVLCVAGPGLLLYRVSFNANRIGLTAVSLAVPLGIAVQLVGFVLLAPVGLGQAAWLTAPVLGLVSLPFLRRTRRAPTARPRRRIDRAVPVIVAAIGLVAAVEMALRDFPQHPLPRQIGAAGAVYSRDMAWHLGNLAAATRSWPLINPRLAGEPFRYHVGAYIAGAAEATVARIDRATVMLRLDPIVYTMVLALLLVWLGREAGGSLLAGLAAACLVLLMGDASSLERVTDTSYANYFVVGLYLSPTYLLGLVLFVPLLWLGARFMQPDARIPAREAAVWIVLVAASGLTKPTGLPILACAAGLFCAVHLARTHRLHVGALFVALSIAVVFAVLGPLVLPGASADFMRWNPLASIRKAQEWKALRDTVPHWVLMPLVVAGHAPMMWLGTAALLLTARPVPPALIWLLLVALSGAAPALLFSAGADSQIYFWLFGYLALSVVAAAGFVRAIERRSTFAGRLFLAVAGIATLVCAASIAFQSRPGVKAIMGQSFRMFQRNPDNQLPDKPADISGSMAQALLWTARNTDPMAVLAVNDQSLNFYYSGLTGRAVLLDNPIYTEDATRVPREERRQALTRLFGAAGEQAICPTAAQFGVDYLLAVKRASTPVDRVTASPRFPAVFENEEVRVVSLASCGAFRRTRGSL